MSDDLRCCIWTWCYHIILIDEIVERVLYGFFSGSSLERRVQMLTSKLQVWYLLSTNCCLVRILEPFLLKTIVWRRHQLYQQQVPARLHTVRTNGRHASMSSTYLALPTSDCMIPPSVHMIHTNGTVHRHEQSEAKWITFVPSFPSKNQMERIEKEAYFQTERI